MLCLICKKVTRTGGKYKKLRGKYNPTGKRKRHPNLQWVSLPNGGRMKMCASCKKKAVKEPSFLRKKGIA